MQAVLNLLSYPAMSGDETDTGHQQIEGHSRYKIIKQVWRSRELTRFLRTLDILHLRERTTSTGRPTPGNLPRVRVASERKNENAPEGLPEYCYDPGWLSRQTTDVKWRLKVEKSSLKAKKVFKLPEDIRE